MSNPYLGEIRPFAGNFAPRGWAFCAGQLTSIAQSTALFSLLGTTYGGDGQVTFGLPDLRGRLALGQGQGPGLTNRTLGEMSGSETVTLTVQQLPAHTHAAIASASEVSSPAPLDKIPAAPKNGGKFYLPTGVGTQTAAALDAATISSAGGNQPHNNIMPTTAINYIIALEGIYPSRN